MVEQIAASWRQTILLVCGVGGRSIADARPYGPKSWNRLAGRLTEVGVEPAEFAVMSSALIEKRLAIPEVEADRLHVLLGRAGQLAIELERLEARGIWVTTLDDETYPRHLRERLGASAPPLLFGSGAEAILDLPGVAIVGSRDADEDALEFTARLAAKAAAEGLSVVSGGARGVDSASMSAAAERGGHVVGVLAESLERRIREGAIRALLEEQLVVLVSPYHPASGFSVGAAMGRNKLIYALSEAAVVVSTAKGEGGTWSGAIEALEGGWVPVFVRSGLGVPVGNSALIDRGAVSLDDGIDAGFSVHALLEQGVRARIKAAKELSLTLWDEA